MKLITLFWKYNYQFGRSKITWATIYDHFLCNNLTLDLWKNRGTIKICAILPTPTLMITLGICCTQSCYGMERISNQSFCGYPALAQSLLDHPPNNLTIQNLPRRRLSSKSQMSLQTWCTFRIRLELILLHVIVSHWVWNIH